MNWNLKYGPMDMIVIFRATATVQRKIIGLGLYYSRYVIGHTWDNFFPVIF